MGRPRKNPEEKATEKKTRKPRVKKLKDLYLDEASSPKEAEIRRNQLKALIILGKERGYLTHAEINDHLLMKFLKRIKSMKSFQSFMTWVFAPTMRLHMLKIY